MHVHDQPALAFYAQPAAMTSGGRYAPLLESLPRDIPGLAAVAQGLLIHEHMAQAYGVTLSETDRASVHLRPVEPLLAQIAARDDRPLHIARTPAVRLPGNCRHFTVLMAAMLRAHGTPARARCGFGGYFGSSLFEDHWACEYWQRWILVDAQIDDRRRDWFPIDFDVTDVPRDRFLIAGQAWARCRSGAADPGRFGLSLTGEAGDWWIAGNLMRDAAALRNIELLPWDCWGAMPGPGDPISGDLAGLFDRLSDLTQTPDAVFAELRQLCQDDDRLRVPQAVRTAARGREEAPLTRPPPPDRSISCPRRWHASPQQTKARPQRRGSEIPVSSAGNRTESPDQVSPSPAVHRGDVRVGGYALQLVPNDTPMICRSSSDQHA